MFLYRSHTRVVCKRPGAKTALELSGRAHVLLMAIICLVFVIGGLYLYSVNRSSVQGYAMRSLEKEIRELKKVNAELRVREAEARSLPRVEAGTTTLRMEKVTQTETLTNDKAVALR